MPVPLSWAPTQQQSFPLTQIPPSTVPQFPFAQATQTGPNVNWAQSPEIDWEQVLMDILNSNTGQILTAPARAIYKGGQLTRSAIEGNIPTPESVADVTKDLGAAGAARTMMGGMGVGIFGGTIGRGASFEKLRKATEMENKGAPVDAIWGETGWARGAEDKWRREISDEGFRFKPTADVDNALSNQTGAYTGFKDWVKGNQSWRPLKDQVEYPGLFDAYPELGDIRFAIQRDPNQNALGVNIAGGPDMAHLKTHAIGIRGGDNTDDLLQTLIHELQHAVQVREGFDMGGGPGDPAIHNAARALFDINGIGKGLSPDEMKMLQNEMAFRIYLRMGGETEARNAQRRLGKGSVLNLFNDHFPAEAADPIAPMRLPRLAPAASQDVPFDEQFLRLMPLNLVVPRQFRNDIPGGS